MVPKLLVGLIYGAVFQHFKSYELEIVVLYRCLRVDSTDMAQTSHERCCPANGGTGDDYKYAAHESETT